MPARIYAIFGIGPLKPVNNEGVRFWASSPREFFLRALDALTYLYQNGWAEGELEVTAHASARPYALHRLPSGDFSVRAEFLDGIADGVVRTVSVSCCNLRLPRWQSHDAGVWDRLHPGKVAIPTQPPPQERPGPLYMDPGDGWTLNDRPDLRAAYPAAV
jgi:hypothetical protein